MPLSAAAPCFIMVLVCSCAPAIVLAQPIVPPVADVSSEDVEFFEKQIRPLLATHCVECHGPDKQSGGLRLDRHASVLHGGETGPAITPGQPDESLLLAAVNYESYEMPPAGKLPPEQIALLTDWISRGAPWPADATAAEGDGRSSPTFDLEARKQHWSFQPIRVTPPPVVRDLDWPRGDIDRFVLARLDTATLQPAADADKRTLIRRAHFDLVGLPPSPQAVAAFLADDSSDAFASVVDALLASPQFGERWGRHWLDLVRYADTLGHEFDFPLPHAWRYRDYVVRALNADLPYDDFVREHIAGDLLPTPRLHPTEGYDESIIATGFWHLHEDKHAPVDVRLAEAERYDNQIDVFSKAFLGLTVACARCHDHKFDAITAADYYALAGFLKSSRRQEAGLDPRGEIADTVSQLRELRDAADALQPPAVQAATEPARAGEEILEQFDVGPLGWSGCGWFAGGWAFGDGPRGGVADSRWLGTRLSGSLRSPNFTIGHDAVLLRVAGEKARVRVVVDGYQMDLFQPLLFAGLTQSVETGGAWVWLRIGGDLHNHRGHRAYIELLDDGPGWIAVDEIRLTDAGGNPGGEVAMATTPAILPGGSAEELARLTAQADALAATLPLPVRVLAMQNGPRCDEDLFIRGNHAITAGLVPRRFLAALGGADQPPTAAGCGRLELAERLLAPSDPFPARVMVNRVWRHLFGEGIVKSVDNFGKLGDEPTHPELLDHLAQGFRDDGWSVKRLIRHVMLSRAYQMAATPHPATAARATETDPTNRLLWSQRLRRLEGEALRDAMLVVAGRLDPQIGGQPVRIYLTPFMDGRGRPGSSGPLDGEGRRSLYLSVRRNFLVPMLTAFDFPTPATCIGRRNTSNVPAQALMLLNDPFVIEMARSWAARADAAETTPDARIAWLYKTAYSRPPTPEETAAALAFVQATGGDWPGLCHVLLNAKELLFVR